jgi:dTMP kinase
MHTLRVCFRQLPVVSRCHSRLPITCSFKSSSRSLVTAAMTQSEAPPRGAFIVFEGADRAGKSTQCAMLVDHLKTQGIDAELWNFPDRTTAIGKMINSYLTSKSDIDDAAVHLLFSANRWEKSETLLNKLTAGTTLVVDRYAYSGVAFTAAKAVPGFGIDWCKAPDGGLPAPDAVFFLNLTAEAAAARGGFGEERYERPAFQEAVLKQFEALKGPEWKVVDASRGIDEIQGELREAAAELVSKCKAGGVPIARLWG